MGSPRGNRLYQLIRQSHIFASAVREVLDADIVRRLSPGPLTEGQFHLLKLIALHGVRQAGEAADFLGVSAPAATKNVDKLERMGLVERRVSPDDRRVQILAASGKGKRLVRRYEAEKTQLISAVAAKFQSRHLDELTRLLEQFSLFLFKEAQPDEGICLRCAAYMEEGCAIGSVYGGCPYREARRERSVAVP